MQGRFPVTLGDETVGSVLVEPQGLYQYYMCRCDLSGEVMMDLYLQMGGECRKLGLLTPCDGGFSLEKRVSGAKYEDGDACFFLRPRRREGSGLFCPVTEQEPFRYLQRLENAYLTSQGGILGVMILDEK